MSLLACLHSETIHRGWGEPTEPCLAQVQRQRCGGHAEACGCTGASRGERADLGFHPESAG
jgi:hypothetical protein